MNDKEKKYLLLLRVLLISAAVAWGVSLAGLVVPWSMVEKELAGMGATLPMDDIMVQYWLKMAAAVYTLMGCFFIIVAVWPLKYRQVIKLIGLMHVVLSVVFLLNGLILGVDGIPLYVDVSFCLFVGVGILVLSRSLRDMTKQEII